MSEQKDLHEVLINDVLCERAVVGTILSFGARYYDVADILTPDCFFDGKCYGIYKAIVEVSRRGDNIDIVSVASELSKEGSTITPYEVADICTETGVKYESVIVRYATRLKELELRRRLYRIGQNLISAGLVEKDDVKDVQMLASDELNGLFGSIQGTFTLTDALNSLVDIISRNMSKGAVMTGTPTGFSRFDTKGGLQPSDLIIVGGRTSNGKSSLCLSMVKNAAEKGEKIAVYSLEMTKEQLAARILSMKSGVPSSQLLYSGDLTPTDLEMIDSARGELPGGNIFFDDKSTSNIETILLSIRKMVLTHGIKGAVIDYIQILSVNSKSSSTREQQMGDACRRLKNLAKELNIWIIAVSQLSRNSQDPEPTLSQLRDSGQIEEAADVVMLVYRPELYGRTFPEPFSDIPEEECKGLAMINVAKGRNIGIFKFLVNFDAQRTYFTDLNDESVYESGSGDYAPIEEAAPF